MNRKTGHRKLLENAKVRRWYENLQARSLITAAVYLNNLGLWLEYLGKDPDSLIELVNNDFEEFKGQVADQIRKLEREGKAGASISISIKPVLSFLKFYNVVVRLGINIKNETRHLNAEKEIIPEKYQLRSVLLAAQKRERVAISLMAFSGLRPEVLGNYNGTDGLRLSDLPELHWNGDIEIKAPIKIEVRAELSKARFPFFTFLGEEGCNYLMDYLKDRKNNGETLIPDSPLILPEQSMSRRESPNDFLTTMLLSRRVKRVIRKAEFEWRPYLFRAYFSTSLDIAESKGLISHPWRMFLMGHKGDMESVYSTNKRLLPGMIEDMRNAYAKCLPFLETESRISQSVEDLERSFTARALKLFGFSDSEVKQMENLSDDELQKRIQEHRGMSLNNNHRQRVIGVGEVEKYITDGWEFVNVLPGDKAIIKLP